MMKKKKLNSNQEDRILESGTEIRRTKSILYFNFKAKGSYTSIQNQNRGTKEVSKPQLGM